MRFATSGAISCSMRTTSAVRARRTVSAGASFTGPFCRAPEGREDRTTPDANGAPCRCRTPRSGPCEGSLPGRDLACCRADQLAALAGGEHELTVLEVDEH